MTREAGFERIRDWPLGGAEHADAFRRRLMQENSWSREFTEDAMREYLRFAWLASSSSELLSPSDAVDQVWHLHVLHSADYRRFQREALGRPLDHTPSRGGDEERRRHVAAYARTLDLYREAFPGVAPIDVWPPISEHLARPHR